MLGTFEDKEIFGPVLNLEITLIYDKGRDLASPCISVQAQRPAKWCRKNSDDKMWVNVSSGQVKYAYLQTGKSALASTRPQSIAVTHKREVEKAEALLKELIGILKKSSDQKDNRTCMEAVTRGFWSETGTHQETMILEEYWKEKADGRPYCPPKGEKELYAVMVTAIKLIMRHAKYKNGANRLVDLLKGS